MKHGIVGKGYMIDYDHRVVARDSDFLEFSELDVSLTCNRIDGCFVWFELTGNDDLDDLLSSGFIAEYFKDVIIKVDIGDLSI